MLHHQYRTLLLVGDIISCSVKRHFPDCLFVSIRQIRKFLTVQSTKTLIHTFVSSHLDYCNALLFGLPKYQLDRLQKVQNTAARMTFQITKFDHITPALIDLHWLPITFRVQFKMAPFCLQVTTQPKSILH